MCIRAQRAHRCALFNSTGHPFCLTSVRFPHAHCPRRVLFTFLRSRNGTSGKGTSRSVMRAHSRARLGTHGRKNAGAARASANSAAMRGLRYQKMTFTPCETADYRRRHGSIRKTLSDMVPETACLLAEGNSTEARGRCWRASVESRRRTGRTQRSFCVARTFGQAG